MPLLSPPLFQPPLLVRHVQPHSIRARLHVPIVCDSIPLPLSLQTSVKRALDSQGLRMSSCTWHPPVLTVYVSGDSAGVCAEDCAKASRVLSGVLDGAEFANGAAYTLQVSSEGVADVLTEGREFVVFRGFPVRVGMKEVWKGKKEVRGRLVGRDRDGVRVGVRGRIVTVPIEIVEEVRLCTERDV